MSSISKASFVTQSVKYLSFKLIYLLHSNRKCLSFHIIGANLRTRSSTGALGLLYLPVSECALILR